MNKYPIILSNETNKNNQIRFEGERVIYNNGKQNIEISYDKSIEDIFGTIKLIGGKNEELKLSGKNEESELSGKNEESELIKTESSISSIYKYALSAILDIYRNEKDSSVMRMYLHKFNTSRKKQLEFLSVIVGEAVEIFSGLERRKKDKTSPFDQWCKKEKN